MPVKPTSITKSGKRRRYHSESRKNAALHTRRLILDSARLQFLKLGYAASTMADIARDAGIALDTVYAVVGKKPDLFLLLVESAISGQDEVVSVEKRDYIQAIRADKNATNKLLLYASALSSIHPRLAPLFQVLQAAAPLDHKLKALWHGIAERRARNMLLLAENLYKTGQVRPELTISIVSDILWSMNSPEFYLLLVLERGWTPEEYERWLGQAWCRLLLK